MTGNFFHDTVKLRLQRCVRMRLFLRTWEDEERNDWGVYVSELVENPSLVNSKLTGLKYQLVTWFNNKEFLGFRRKPSEKRY